MSTEARIAPGCRVTLHFSLRLAGGDLIDGTRERAPGTFVVGDGTLLPGFEAALLGLRAGDRRSVLVTADEGFGPWREENLQDFRGSDFPPETRLEPGLVVSFADRKGELPGVVKQVDGDRVRVDFNHPLAGRDLDFDVEILAVELPAAEQPVQLRDATPRGGAA
jgi:FKBP-type peptidyl-prolyl cis-trans isomerase SlpA